jgi:hypothetical protein
MHPIWVGIDSTSEGTRVLATTGPTVTILKARLAANVQHPRAVPTLLEALALWQGTPVHAALVVDAPGSLSATRLCLDAWPELGGAPLYRVEFVPRGKRRHHDRLSGFGRFADLRQLVLFEVAR